jgi:hypothetical protein
MLEGNNYGDVRRVRSTGEGVETKAPPPVATGIALFFAFSQKFVDFWGTGKR